MRALLVAAFVAQILGPNLSIERPLVVPGFPPDCTVLKLPAIVCPATINLDVAFSPAVTIFGGDNLVFAGEAGCPVVRHELYITPNGSAPAAGVLEDSWAQVELVGPTIVSPARTITLTTAQHSGMGSPGTVDVYARSYTPDDFAFKEDFCTTAVLP